MPDEKEYTDTPLAIGRYSADDVEAAESWYAQWVEGAERSKWPRALQYFENASFLLGNHLTRFYYQGGSFSYHTFGVDDSSPYDSLVAKVADNRLVRPVESVVSMLTEPKPAPRVEPNSDSPEDEDAAAISEHVIQLFFEQPLAMQEKRRELAMLGAICGTAAIETEYAETDLPVEVPKYKAEEQPNPFHGEIEGEPETVEVLVPDGTETVFRRDMVARVWTPFHLTPDPMATSPDTMRWIARTSFEDIEWIAEAFVSSEEGYQYSDREELLDAIGEVNASHYVLYWWHKLQDIVESPQHAQHGGGLSPNASTSASILPGQTTFTVVDVKPTKAHPRGRTLIYAGGKLIYSGDARSWTERYPWRWHPYAFWGWFKVPGRFWHYPLLSALVPLQKRINAIDALVQTNRAYISIGQWLIPRHSRLAEGRISGLPGEQYEYTSVPGLGGPERVRNEPLPSELLIERDQLLQSIDYIAASSLVGGELSASAARAGVILDFLRQEKLQTKNPMIREYERALETVGQNILIELQTNLTEEDPELSQRLMRATQGEYSSLTLESFTGASLRDHHAVRLDIASELRHSPEAKRDEAMTVAQYLGANMDAHQKEAVFRAVGLDEYMKGKEQQSVRRARRMISRIKNGRLEAALPMDGIDDPRAMAPVFQNAILEDTFYDLDPKAKGVLVAMFDHYSQQAKALEQQELQMMMMMRGGGQGAGGGNPGQ